MDVSSFHKVYNEWESMLIEERYVHQDIQCDACHKEIRGKRHRCKTCDDFDLCSGCILVSAKAHTQDHSFYCIQYRNLTIPPIDGDDYEMLCRFRDDEGSENFYMHYPWFFNSRIIDRLLNGMPREEVHRSALEPLIDFSQDQYIRTVRDEDWNWRGVKEFVSYMIDLQITRAQYSQSFYGLFQTLQEQQRECLDPEKESNAQVDASSLKLQLHVEKLNPAAFRAATEIFRRYCIAQEEYWKIGRRDFPIGKVSNRLKYLHQIVTKAQSPIQGFPILEEVSLLLNKGKERYGHDLRWNVMQHAHNRQQIHEAYQRCCVGMTVHIHLEQRLSKLPSSSVILDRDQRLLQEIRILRRLGFFEAALEKLNSMDQNHPRAVFQRVAVFESQGNFGKAVHASSTEILSSSDSIEDLLLRVVRSYLQCFTKGLWLQALQTVENSLKSVSRSPTNDDSIQTEIYLELYCFKILNAVQKDLLKPISTLTWAAKRLHACRMHLQRLGEHYIALDLLELELDLGKHPASYPVSVEPEQVRRMVDWRAEAKHASCLIDDFLNSLHALQLPEESLDNLAAEGYANLMLVRALIPHEKTRKPLEEVIEILDRAESNFTLSGCKLGMAEAKLMRIGLRSHEFVKEEEIKAIQETFENLQYFRGLEDVIRSRHVRIMGGLDPAESDASTKYFEQLATFYLRSGNMRQFQICRLRSMRQWTQAPTFIIACEQTFHPDEGFDSEELCIQASWLLSQLYSLNHNFAEAEAYALLHLKYIQAQEDPQALHYAILNYLRTVVDVSSDLPDVPRIEEFTNIAYIWDIVLYQFCQTIEKFDLHELPSYAGLSIDTCLWFSTAIGSNVDEDSLQPLSRPLLSTLVANIKLAIDLVTLLPTNLRLFYISKLGKALGLASEYSGNPLLSLLCNEEALPLAKVQDEFDHHLLKLQIGGRLSSMIHWDRPNFQVFQPLARSRLIEAQSFFWENSQRQAFYQSAVTSSMALGRSYLRELQILIEDLNWGEGESTEGLELVQVENRRQLIDIADSGIRCVKKGIDGSSRLRDGLHGMPPMQALENQRSFFLGDMEVLHWVHMGLELDRARVNRDYFRFWEAIQEWKAVCLVDVMARSMANERHATRIVKSLAEEPLRSPLPKEQNILPVLASPPEQLDVSPAHAEDVGETNIHNALLTHSQVPQTSKGEKLEKELWSMAELAERNLDNGKSLIFIDWTRYEDTFFLAAYNATSGGLITRVVECDYSAVEHWVAECIGSFEDEQGNKVRKRLRQTDKLKELYPLFEKLNTFIEKDDLLVLCAAGVLRSVPLHAIPFPSIEDPPIIAHNPVVYCASNALMARCVSRANERIPDSCRAIAITRLGPEDPIEEARMYTTAKLAMQYFSDPIIVSGRDATRRSFIDTSKNANFLHYHGHASLESSACKDRALSLEPTDSDPGLLDVMDIFGLQFKAATVVLLACASSEEDLTPNDDPLGIISAFMYAGASSIVGTLWPTQTEDARVFSEAFYRYAFGGERGEGVDIRNLYLAKAFQQAVLELYELWDGEEPYHWAHFQLHGAWFCNMPQLPSSSS